MEYEKIKQLMDDMGNFNLTALEIEFPDGIKISMKKEEKQVVVSTPEETVFSKEVIIKNNEQPKDICVEKEQGVMITSPMVGIFYSKPSPTSESYVQVGKKVKKGDVICIIEAMKLMNEIEAECDGEIADVYLNDGDVVDFGKPLFRIV